MLAGFRLPAANFMKLIYSFSSPNMNLRPFAIPFPISNFSKLLPSPDSSFVVVHSWVISIMRLSPFDPSVSEMRALERSYGWQIIKLSAQLSMHCNQKKMRFNKGALTKGSINVWKGCSFQCVPCAPSTSPCLLKYCQTMAYIHNTAMHDLL